MANLSCAKTCPLRNRSHVHRHDEIKGRVARVTFLVRAELRDFIDDFPCNLIGHNWVEIPRTLRISRHSDGKKMRFKCSRCYLTAGFSN